MKPCDLTAEDILSLASHGKPLPKTYLLPDAWLYEIAVNLTDSVKAGFTKPQDARRRYTGYSSRWEELRRLEGLIHTTANALGSDETARRLEPVAAGTI